MSDDRIRLTCPSCACEFDLALALSAVNAAQPEMFPRVDAPAWSPESVFPAIFPDYAPASSWGMDGAWWDTKALGFPDGWYLDATADSGAVTGELLCSWFSSAWLTVICDHTPKGAARSALDIWRGNQTGGNRGSLKRRVGAFVQNINAGQFMAAAERLEAARYREAFPETADVHEGLPIAYPDPPDGAGIGGGR